MVVDTYDIKLLIGIEIVLEVSSRFQRGVVIHLGLKGRMVIVRQDVDKIQISVEEIRIV